MKEDVTLWMVCEISEGSLISLNGESASTHQFRREAGLRPGGVSGSRCSSQSSLAPRQECVSGGEGEHPLTALGSVLPPPPSVASTRANRLAPAALVSSLTALFLTVISLPLPSFANRFIPAALLPST